MVKQRTFVQTLGNTSTRDVQDLGPQTTFPLFHPVSAQPWLIITTRPLHHPLYQRRSLLFTPFFKIIQNGTRPLFTPINCTHSISRLNIFSTCLSKPQSSSRACSNRHHSAYPSPTTPKSKARPSLAGMQNMSIN